MLKVQNKKKFTIFVAMMLLVIAAIIFGTYKIFKWYKQTPPIERLSIKDASKDGEKKTVQLLIQIASPNAAGALERGDVVLSAPEDKQFSLAEKEGFLIIKMRLTQSEQDLLSLALNEKPGVFASEQEQQSPKTIKNRKFAVDLEKIGISSEEKTGRIIENRVFEDDVLVQKN